jgi:iron complex transport system ATP-binding protein
LNPKKSKGQKAVSVAILAGGLSSRMGCEKASLSLSGMPLLDRVLSRAQQLDCSIDIIREDLFERCGPIGGVLTAFSVSKAARILFLPCDMPFISADFLRLLIKKSQESGRAVFASPVSERGKARPSFPFVLPRSSLATIHKQIDAGEFAIHELAEKLNAQYISPADSNALFNINTRSDLRKAERLIRTQEKETILSLQNLTIRRGKIVILDDLNWQVKQGENWVILGANGSGKTSLLTALMGYMTPTSGIVRVLGKQYGRADWRNLRLQLGLVSSAVRQMMAESEPALLSVVSGKYAQIDYWGKPKPADRKEALHILEQVECSYLADRPWIYLSQGERQRVLIGRALMAKPAVLILDEPCAGLDPVARESFLQFLQRLSRSRNAPALVLVTHHVEEIVPAFTHALLLKAGGSLAAGPIGKILKSANLSSAFNTPMRLSRSRNSYQLRLLKIRNEII